MKGLTIAVIGATGSIGRLVIEEGRARGHVMRAVLRNAAQAARFPGDVQTVIADITRAETLGAVLEGVDAVVFTHGAHGGRAETEAVDYGAVRNLLQRAGAQPLRIALMTAIGVTNRTGSHNRRTEAHDWKRRSERLLRASGHPYTIIRPGWFDYNRADENLPRLLQGDRRQSGTPSDGVIARSQIAALLIHCLTSEAARNKTFELIAQSGQAPADLDSLLAPLAADPPGAMDGVGDNETMPLSAEPARVRADLAAFGVA